MSVWVAIVSYCNPAMTVDCLRSLEPQLREISQARVLVVDNASPDGAAQTLQAAVRQHRWDDWLMIIPSERNLGFAGGNNVAIRAAHASPRPPKYLLLLNPDTILRPGAVEALLRFMDAHPEVGIAGSRLEHPDGRPQTSAFRFPSVLSELEHGFSLGLLSRLLRQHVVARPIPQAACLTDWVAGASMIVRREVFDTVGYMDEGFFLYYEEVDFCLRARRKGWPCWYVPQSRVVHLVGQSSGVTAADAAQRRRPRYWFDSRRRYFCKSHGRLYGIAADVVWTCGFLFDRVRRRIQRKPGIYPPCLLRDFVRSSSLFHSL